MAKKKSAKHRKRKHKSRASLAYGKYFIHEHSLSLNLALITVVLKIAGGITPEGYWRDFFNGFGDDAWGAFLIILCTKYFTERGSPESGDERK